MIHSALVFSPRPSHDPRENLRILKSPLKGAFKSPMKCGSPIPARTTLFGSPSEKLQGDEEEEEEAIILVDGNHPRVVEEEKDLVILEDVPVSQVATNDHLAPQPFLYSPQPQTPVRSRSVPRNSLHRAVLIRSAQRAVIKAEREREEHEEEMEVLETVASELEECDDDEEEPEGPDEVNEGTLGEEEGEDCDNSSTPKLTWQKSIERLWPFRSSSPHDEVKLLLSLSTSITDTNSLRMRRKRSNKRKNRKRTRTKTKMRMSLHRSLTSFPKPLSGDL